MASTNGLPDEVSVCLQNARFLHLATVSRNVPHISLMNYTYLPETPYSPYPTIIMTTPPSSKKTHNLQDNPLVSLLVHDWVSHRPPTLDHTARSPSPSPSRPNHRSGSLAELLLGINTASLGRISATINGVADMIPSGTAEEEWYKAQHLANNTFGPADDTYASSPADAGLWGGGGLQRPPQDDPAEGDGGTRCYVQGEQVRVVVVRIRDGRVADWKGHVRDWAVVTADESAPVVNGL